MARRCPLRLHSRRRDSCHCLPASFPLAYCSPAFPYPATFQPVRSLHVDATCPPEVGRAPIPQISSDQNQTPSSHRPPPSPPTARCRCSRPSPHLSQRPAPHQRRGLHYLLG